MSIEVRAQNTLSMTSVKAIKDAVDEADRMVSYIDQSVYGTITYEYDNNGTIETVYKRDDGTYYYIQNGVEITVAESDLERDSETGQLLTDREKDGLDTTIEQAQEFATEAHSLAEQAQTSADEAQTSANRAYGYATSAYNQLADIEKVVDVLEWTAQHGEYASTPDTEVQTDKYYFTRTGYGGGTYNGSMVTFETLEGNNISSVTADIEPIQDLHGYDAPWVGGAGKNLLPLPYTNTGGNTNGITYSVSSDGKITISNTATATVWVRLYGGFASDSASIKKPVPSWIEADKTYTLSGGQSANVRLQINFYQGSTSLAEYKDEGSGVSFTPTSTIISNADTMAVFLRIANGTTASGTISPMIRLSSTSATWTPYENICPISGHTDVVVNRTGKNLLDTSTAEIGTAWNGASNSARARLVIPLVVGQTYTLKANGTSTLDSWYGIETDTIPPSSVGAVLSNPYTFTATTKYLSLGFNKTAIASTDIEALKLQLELGSSATTYEAHQGDTYTIDLDGTRYGARLDVTSGVLTVTHGYADLGDLTWVADATNKRFYTNSKSSEVKPPTGNAYPFNAISSAFKSVTFNTGHGDTSLDGVMYCSGSGFISVRWLAHESDTANAFKTAVTGTKVCYELATPQTYQLTAQQITALQGTNHVWANSGDITVVVKDTYSYPLVNRPTGNPSAQGWYELTGVDQAITQYVATHLALTDDGLYVQVDNSSSKIQITGSGVYLWNTGKRIAQYTNEVVLGDIDDVHIVLSPTNGLEFYQGASKVAWITANTMHIQQAEIESNLRIGQFLWKVQSANRISLVYAPQ